MVLGICGGPGVLWQLLGAHRRLHGSLPLSGGWLGVCRLVPGHLGKRRRALWCLNSINMSLLALIVNVQHKILPIVEYEKKTKIP